MGGVDIFDDDDNACVVLCEKMDVSKRSDKSSRVAGGGRTTVDTLFGE